METFFKKYFWVAQLLFVAVAALLLAGTVNGFASGALARYSVAVPAEPPRPAATDDDSAAPDLRLDRRVIGPPPETQVVDLCADVECEEDEECDPATGSCVTVEDEVADGASDGRCIESDIAINLVGTMVADEPEWSLAILHNPSIGQTQFARIGTNLLAEADVTRIERGRIFMTRNGREECLRPGDQQTRAQRAAEQGNTRPSARPSTGDSAPNGRRPITAAPVASARPSGGNQTVEERIATQVERQDDGSYAIPRDLIQDVANNSALMEEHAPRVVPNYDNGQPRGFRLQGIRSGSIFSAIGIRNGDVIVGVNGTDIDSPQRALELYQALLQQQNVTVSILRRGREQTLRYNIR